MIQAYAAQKPGGLLKPWTYDPGDLHNDDVEISVKFCGICHSDVSMLDNAWGMSQYPLVPGHEVAGVVSAVGSAVTSLKIGQSVGLGWHAGYCNHCAICDSGDQNLCSGARGTIVGHHGGFADKVRAKADSVVLIPDGMDMATVGPLFCGGITVFNPLVQFDIKPTDRVAVIGIGGLGHMALAFLNAWGCHVTAFTSSESKRQEALELGAHQTLSSTDMSAITAAAGQFDLILSTVNVKLDWNLFLGTLKPKGRLHFVGATLEPLDLGVFGLIASQRQVSGSPVGSPETIRKMLDFAHQHQIKPVVEIYPMSEVNEAIEKIRSNRAHYRLVLQNS